jgi:hypothetical protein
MFEFTKNDVNRKMLVFPEIQRRLLDAIACRLYQSRLGMFKFIKIHVNRQMPAFLERQSRHLDNGTMTDQRTDKKTTK